MKHISAAICNTFYSRGSINAGEKKLFFAELKTKYDRIIKKKP